MAAGWGHCPPLLVACPCGPSDVRETHPAGLQQGDGRVLGEVEGEDRFPVFPQWADVLTDTSPPGPVPLGASKLRSPQTSCAVPSRPSWNKPAAPCGLLFTSCSRLRI